MKMFLIAGSSLAAVAAAGSAGAVDVTLGGSINMGVEFGLGKNANDLAFSDAFNEVSLSIAAAHTTDGGLSFGGAFTMGTAASIEFTPYADAAGDKFLAKRTVDGRTNINANLWNVSGGGAVASANVVSVKINSDWLGIDQQQVEYTLALGSFTSSNICKLAGRGTTVGASIPLRAWAGGGPAAGGIGAAGVDGGYLPAGQFAATDTTVLKTADASSTAVLSVPIGTNGESMSTTRGAVAQISNGNGLNPTATAKTTSRVTVATDLASTASSTRYMTVTKARVDVDGDDSFDVASAAVYVGPFMEVMMASSETKMVVGAACLSGNDSSATAFFMNNASDVMTVSNASIYIDGGFGRLSLQSGDYAGGVSAIAGAGDVADIDANGLVVVAQGLGLMGANPYLAMDLAAGDSLSDLEVITGGTMDLGGVSAGFDMVLGNGADLLSISAWDLGMAYDMGDLSLGFATDSESDWGLSASMAIAGFGVNAVFGSSTAGAHEKSGITYSVTASTALNGFGLAIGFDEDLEPTIGVDYDLGGLNLYAGYDADEEGGSIGATLSF